MAATGAGRLNALFLNVTALFWCACPVIVIAQQAEDAVTPDDSTRAVSSTVERLADRIPLVIAHRGASGYLPEHTTESAAYAHALGADFIEQDVVQTKDGHLVVLHDITLNAVTDVEERFPDRGRKGRHYVFDLTLAEVRSLRVRERHQSAESRRFPAGSGEFQVSTLEEHIQLIQGLNRSTGTDRGLYVEIKKPAEHRSHGLDPSNAVLSLLKKYGYESRDDNVWIQCFDAREIARIRTELACQLPLVQLYGREPTEEQLQAAGKIVDAVGIPVSAVLTGVRDGGPQLSEVISRAHQASLVVHVWTHRDDRLPSGVENSRQLLEWLVLKGGASGIFTDHPDVVLKFRAAIQRSGPIRGPFHLLQGKPGPGSEKNRSDR